MIPSLAPFLAGLRFYARRHALATRYDEAAVEEALAEAERLADVARDEPAALFFACARRSRSFSGAAGSIVPFVVRRQAQALGLQLTMEDIELEILRARVLLGAVDFEELRTRFAALLRPQG